VEGEEDDDDNQLIIEEAKNVDEPLVPETPPPSPIDINPT